VILFGSRGGTFCIRCGSVFWGGNLRRRVRCPPNILQKICRFWSQCFVYWKMFVEFQPETKRILTYTQRMNFSWVKMAQIHQISKKRKSKWPDFYDKFQ
jgi:hypothetical protein